MQFFFGKPAPDPEPEIDSWVKHRDNENIQIVNMVSDNKLLYFDDNRTFLKKELGEQLKTERIEKILTFFKNKYNQVFTQDQLNTNAIIVFLKEKFPNADCFYFIIYYGTVNLDIPDYDTETKLRLINNLNFVKEGGKYKKEKNVFIINDLTVPASNTSKDTSNGGSRRRSKRRSKARSRHARKRRRKSRNIR